MRCVHLSQGKKLATILARTTPDGETKASPGTTLSYEFLTRNHKNGSFATERSFRIMFAASTKPLRLRRLFFVALRSCTSEKKYLVLVSSKIVSKKVSTAVLKRQDRSPIAT